MTNQSECADVVATVTAAVIESEVGAEKANTNLSGGLVIGLPRLHVSLESASETRTVITIANVNVIVLESATETGTGLLGVVVRTAARVVRAAAAVVVEVEVVDTVQPTATGHWPREWDSDIFFSRNETLNNVGRTYMNSWALTGSVNIVYRVRTPPILTMPHHCSPS
jgi:hypothetical protein